MNAQAAGWPAPAKLNLFLHVLGRREDGYHDIETAFQLLDFGDRIDVRPRNDGRIVRVRGAPGGGEENDLMVRAAYALRQAHGHPGLGAELSLDKRIPMGGGLGGGSSDAATTLVVLNRLWRLGLGEDALAGLAFALGADVPLFVRGRSAFGQGRGERLTPIALPQRWFLVLDPGAQVPTGELFQAPDLTRNSAPSTIRRFFSSADTRNVFEPVVRSRYPSVAQALDWLGAHAASRLTGTGGCVFAAFERETEARGIANLCPPAFRAFVARGVDESPLLAAMRETETI